jgi:hypothetical protein
MSPPLFAEVVGDRSTAYSPKNRSEEECRSGLLLDPTPYQPKLEDSETTDRSSWRKPITLD